MAPVSQLPTPRSAILTCPFIQPYDQTQKTTQRQNQSAQCGGRKARSQRHLPSRRRRPIYDEAFRFYGVDISAVPGVSAGVLGVLISEVGTGSELLRAFRSAEAFSPG